MKLKPCPICGGAVDMSKSSDFCGHIWYEIKGCGCGMLFCSKAFSPLETSREKRLEIKMNAIETWNKRKAKDETDEAQRDYQAAVEYQQYCEMYEQTYDPDTGAM